MKIASWNVNSLKVRLHHVLRWLDENQPDVLGLQETKMTDDVFPLAEIEAAGYKVQFSGQKTYNGVALLSKGSAEDVVVDLPAIDDPQRRVMIATVNDVRIFNLYVPNGQDLDSEKFDYKRQWIAALSQYLECQLKEHSQLVMMGDFNITADDRDVHDPDAWRDKIHCSEEERAWLQNLQALGVHDSFRLFEQEAETFSWWDYRGGAFWKNRGLRIDYAFLSDALKDKCLSSKIDKRERRFKQPSDHAPVVIELNL